MKQSLSEDQIRKDGLLFLRRHYTQWQAEGQPMMSTGPQASGKIVTDGFLHYLAADGHEYEVALEATSRQTREEVAFKPLYAKVNWDAFVFSSWTTAFIIGLLVVLGWLGWDPFGLWIFINILAVSLLGTFLIARLSFLGLKRYRYIYAIEQFKAYYSDDQWIAIGGDVFPTRQDIGFRELRRQCLNNGVGLLVVTEAGRIEMIIAASRGSIDLGKRRRVFFLERIPLWQKATEVKPLELLTSAMVRSGIPQAKDLMRFRPTHWKQFFLSLAALLILGIFSYRYIDQRPIRTANRLDIKRLSLLADNRFSEEAANMHIDTPFLAPFREKVTPYLVLQDSLRKLRRPIYLPDHFKFTFSKGRSIDLIIGMAPDSIFAYPCDRIKDLTERNYALKESRQASLAEASKRIRTLQRVGLDMKALRMSCIDGGGSHFLLALDFGFSSRELALVALREYEKQKELEPALPDLEVVRLIDEL